MGYISLGTGLLIQLAPSRSTIVVQSCIYAAMALVHFLK